MYAKKSQSDVSLMEAQGSFYILGIGLLISTTCFIIEQIWYRKKTRTFNVKKASRREFNETVTSGPIVPIDGALNLHVWCGDKYVPGDGKHMEPEVQTEDECPDDFIEEDINDADSGVEIDKITTSDSIF